MIRAINARRIFLTLLITFFLGFSYPQYLQSSPLNGTISTAGTWKFPKVRHNAAGEYVVLIWDVDIPALHFKKWNGTGWIDYTSISTADLSGVPGLGGKNIIFYGNEYRVNFDFDSLSNLHVIFSAGTTAVSSDHDGIHGVYNGSSWSFALIENDVNQPENISLYIDNNDKVHIAYVIDRVFSGNDNLLKYATNNGGSWSSHEILNTDNRGIDELHDTYVVVSDSGTVTVIYRRENNQNDSLDNYHEITSQDYSSFSTPTVILDGQTDNATYQIGALTLNNEDNPALVYSDITNSMAYYAHKANGTWNSERLESTTATIIAALDIQTNQSKLYALTVTNTGYLYKTKSSGAMWQDGEQFFMSGLIKDRFAYQPSSQGFMHVSEDNSNWTAYYQYFEAGANLFPWLLFMPAISAADD